MSIVSRGYWREVRKRAIQESVGPFSGWGGFGFMFFISVATIPIVGLLAGWEDARVEMVIASVPLFVMVTLLLVNAVRAPRLIHEENLQTIVLIEKECDGVQGQLDNKAKQQKLVAATDSRKSAVKTVCTLGRHILGQLVKTEEQWKGWLEMRKVFAVLLAEMKAQLGPYEYSRITQVHYNPSRNYIDKFNDEHQRHWNEMAAVVDAADKYLESL